MLNLKSVGGQMQYCGRIARARNFHGMRWIMAGALLFSLAAAQRAVAQSPNAAASGAAKSDEGLYPGWNLGTRFEGSTSGDGSVYDLGCGGGYNFSHHFGVSLGVAYDF